MIVRPSVLRGHGQALGEVHLVRIRRLTPESLPVAHKGAIGSKDLDAALNIVQYVDFAADGCATKSVLQWCCEPMSLAAFHSHVVKECFCRELFAQGKRKMFAPVFFGSKNQKFFLFLLLSSWPM
jgi:hypothetical protein